MWSVLPLPYFVFKNINMCMEVSLPQKIHHEMWTKNTYKQPTCICAE